MRVDGLPRLTMAWADVIAIVLPGFVLLLIFSAFIPALYDLALRLTAAALIEWHRRRPP